MDCKKNLRIDEISIEDMANLLSESDCELVESRCALVHRCKHLTEGSFLTIDTGHECGLLIRIT
jgi:hypothetical protein